MNEKRAIEAATSAGLQVSDTVKNRDGSKSFTVGKIALHHNGRDGRACWRIDGAAVGYIGPAIMEAVRRQVPQ